MINFKAQITQIMPNVVTQEAILRHPEEKLQRDTSFGKKCRLHRLIFISALLMLSSCATAHTHFMRHIDLKTLKDGTYIGKDTTPLCNVKLATAIQSGKMTDIKILSHFVSYPLAGMAYGIIPKRIIKKQSLDVDAVTGATVSSNNIKRAVLDALEKAK